MQPDAAGCPACGNVLGAGPVPIRPQGDLPSQVPVVHRSESGSTTGSTSPTTSSARPIGAVPVPAEERTVVRPGLPEYSIAAATEPTGPTESEHTRRRWWIPAAIGIVVLVIGGAGFLLWTSLSASDDTLVHVEATTTRVADSFADVPLPGGSSLGSGLPTALDLPAGGGSTSSDGLALNKVRGDHPDLYATIDAPTSDGSAPPICDTEELRAQLVGNAHLAATWTSEIGIDDSVARTLDGLTPVLLGQDTAVTENTYSPDGIHPYQAILQAGTAVLVDDKAQPRVRCDNGNPLSPSRFLVDAGGKAELRGTTWSGFDAGRVVVIDVASATPVTELEHVVDVGTGRSVKLPLNKAES